MPGVQSKEERTFKGRKVHRPEKTTEKNAESGRKTIRKVSWRINTKVFQENWCAGSIELPLCI